ncbi:MAG TPA: polymer-forming cytoskeletal protein [Paracoccaceae bacterium]|nr:polymer-forming cytoskeletal protein [Paracoccaceae bacterium]
MFRRKKDDRPGGPTVERAADRLGERAPERPIERPIERMGERPGPGDRGAPDRIAGAPDRPPFPQAADNVEMPRMIANRPTAPAAPSLQSPPAHQPVAGQTAAQPPQPPNLPPGGPPKPMVPFVAPAQPGFAVRPPQSAATPQPREARSEAPPDGGKRLLVGRDIYLSGQITSCDRLLVEGRVEATLSDSSTIEIAESGIFKGRAEINDAEIAGRFEGDITVRGRLFIRATGRLRGKIRYGQIEIEPGGEIAGEVEVMTKAPGSGFASDDDALERRSANGHDETSDILGHGYAESESKLV